MWNVNFLYQVFGFWEVVRLVGIGQLDYFYMVTMPKSQVISLNRRRSDEVEPVLEQLYRDHEEAIRSFLIGRIRDHSELDDIVQEVFVRVARSKELSTRQQFTKRQNRAYLFTAANNLIVDMERRKSVRRNYLSANEEERNSVYELSPDVVVEARQELSAIKKAVKQLKPTWRKAFVMARFQNVSYQEISEEMGVSIRQIEKYIANSIKALRKAVPNRGEK